MQFSIYGAIAKVTHMSPDGVQRQPLIWDTLYRGAIALNDCAHGGNNHVHPVIQFNETEGRTAREVLMFLATCADECERIGDATYEVPIRPPVKAVVEHSPVPERSVDLLHRAFLPNPFEAGR